MANHVFTHRLDVRFRDCDAMGHVNNASYLKWVQDAVVSHWQRLAPADAVAGHLWVALFGGSAVHRFDPQGRLIDREAYERALPGWIPGAADRRMSR